MNFVFLLFLFLLNCHPDGSSDVFLFGGTPASSFLVHPHVRLVQQTSKYGSFQNTFCTGVLIDTFQSSSDFLVTQLHCFVEKNPKVKRFSQFSDILMETLHPYKIEFFSDTGKLIGKCSVTSVLKETSSYDSKMDFNSEANFYEKISQDLALIELKNCPFSSYRKKLPVISLNSVRKKKGVMIQSGYGKVCEKDVLSNKAENLLFFLTNDIDWSRKRYGVEFHTVSKQYQNTCHGDSGGSLTFYEKTLKRLSLIGTLYGANGHCDEKGGQSTYLEIYPNLYWIEDAIKSKVNVVD
jgi:hypothetical protein